MRSALSEPPPRGSARRGPAGEITVNFIFGTFLTMFSTRNSEGRQILKTGRRDSNCIFGLKKVAPAYGFGVGNVGTSAFDILGPFLSFQPSHSAGPSTWSQESLRLGVHLKLMWTSVVVLAANKLRRLGLVP